MRLLASTDYALRVLLRLAREPGQRNNTDILAREVGVPRNHLQKIVQDLAAMGLVLTQRGAGGGVLLAHPPSEISIGAVVRGFEQGQALVECFRADGGACCLSPDCRLRGALARAQDAFLAFLDQMTIADCLVPGHTVLQHVVGDDGG